MKLEQQVTNLELSKKLKELGVKQESLFYWNRCGEYYIQREKVVARKAELTNEKPPYDFPYEVIASAFTVAELGEMLNGKFPNVFVTYRENIGGTMFWICIARTDVEGMMKSNDYRMAHTEVDVRAKMLGYLIENKLITL